MKFNFIHISDSHEQHDLMYWLKDPEYIKDIDCIIHTGDGANPRSPILNAPKLDAFLNWFKDLKIKHKIWIPGNHDTSFEAGLIDFRKYELDMSMLIDEKTTIFKGDKSVTIYGSPRSPSFGQGWAYNVSRSKIQNYWNQIPVSIDILATHSPPLGIGDLTQDYTTGLYTQVGCKSLYNTIQKVKPKYHLYGHLHDEPFVKNYGHRIIGDVNYINSAVCDLKHRLVHPGHKFSIEVP